MNNPNKSIFIWTEYKNYPAKIRNTAIGTLIIDINDGVELEEAVAKYEKVVAQLTINEPQQLLLRV